MKRTFFALAGLALCACAGVLAALVAAASAPSATGTSTGTTVGTTTTVPTTTPPPPPPRTIAPGVSIAGAPVGGLAAAQASAAVRARFEQPLVVVVRRHTFRVRPAALGAAPAIGRAVERALVAPAGANVPLAVTVRRDRVRRWVGLLAKRFARTPVNAYLSLRNLRPFITSERPGRVLDRAAAERAILRALTTHRRGPLRLRPKVIRPAVTRSDFGPLVVIRRGSHRLYLYRGMRFVRMFPVATGTTTYPTPLGRFRVVVKWKHPWWYPPDSPWAKDKEPVPPGPTNPLGTRWMGISSPGVGIHGTPEPGSIGYSVSHGCIRMRISDAEWLFERVQIGTPVFIVPA